MAQLNKDARLAGVSVIHGSFGQLPGTVGHEFLLFGYRAEGRKHRKRYFTRLPASASYSGERRIHHYEIEAFVFDTAAAQDFPWVCLSLSSRSDALCTGFDDRECPLRREKFDRAQTHRTVWLPTERLCEYFRIFVSLLRMVLI